LQNVIFLTPAGKNLKIKTFLFKKKFGPRAGGKNRDFWRKKNVCQNVQLFVPCDEILAR